MGNTTEFKTRGQQAIEKARDEVEAEDMKDAVTKLKAKLRELKDAETIVANIKREITDLEEAISQGNA
jgi:exonuclease VII small subunit